MKQVYIYNHVDYCKKTDSPCQPEKCGVIDKDSCIFLVRKKDIPDERKL
jgi:hypothetical protein